MGAVLAFTHQLETITCGDCGVEFAMPVDLMKKKQEDRANFWCPNGHQRHFIGETDAQKYKRLYEQEQRQRQWAEEAKKNAQVAATKAKNKLKKVEQRVANGVCPCCNRTFVNLQRHMHTKHPEFASNVEQLKP